jgi:hypothetical protein
MKRLLVALALIAPWSATISTIAMAPAVAATAATTALGDLSSYEAIAVDTLAIVKKGDMVAAEKRITDFETAWDNAEPTMRPMNIDQWGVVDDAADVAISSLRASKPVAADAEAAVNGLIAALRNPAGQ